MYIQSPNQIKINENHPLNGKNLVSTSNRRHRHKIVIPCNKLKILPIEQNVLEEMSRNERIYLKNN